MSKAYNADIYNTCLTMFDIQGFKTCDKEARYAGLQLLHHRFSFYKGCIIPITKTS